MEAQPSRKIISPQRLKIWQQSPKHAIEHI